MAYLNLLIAFALIAALWTLTVRLLEHSLRPRPARPNPTEVTVRRPRPSPLVRPLASPVVKGVRIENRQAYR